MKGMFTYLFPNFCFTNLKNRSGYAIFRLAFEALVNWYLNRWQDQIFCEGQPFRF